MHIVISSRDQELLVDGDDPQLRHHRGNLRTNYRQVFALITRSGPLTAVPKTWNDYQKGFSRSAGLLGTLYENVALGWGPQGPLKT
jgi:hypothetical protein